MANKGQQGKKEAKKPKKDSGSNKPPVFSERPSAVITTVIPERGKKAKG
ncbi:hypothetical protein [Roseateles violae]|uniref:Uncharacterized protein n=1 Tax=Roseateles violae TaxID=3058042 RepID=A0ABT8DYX7_9BURK|nr:hypothetical protein [Pelomonas sp. PFR6]MDN3922800.1 hypothetical protein [Pelomonas sp. PFR6]